MDLIYSRQEMEKICKIILNNCEKILRDNYGKVYKWSFGEEVPVKVIEGALYKIGNVKYKYPSLKKEDIFIIVSSSNGKEGMVFGFDGIYYKAGAFHEAQFEKYEDCISVDSFTDLGTDANYIFNTGAVNEMFAQIQSALHGDIPVKVKNYSQMESDYGKHIENPKIQEAFLRFLEKEEKKSNEAARHYWEEAFQLTDTDKKIKLLLLGVKEGDALSSQELGEMYIKGEEVPKDLKKAEEYLRFPAECGYSESMYFFGLICMQKGDKADCLDWLCKAAVKGDANAFMTLAKYAAEDTDKDLIEARLSVYFREVCENGQNDYKTNRFLGWCYMTGICCAQNLGLAKTYWKAGADQNDVRCKVYMDICGLNRNGETLQEKTAETASSDLESAEENFQGFGQEREAEENGVNRKAAASVILGVVSLRGVLWTAVLGLILGVRARKEQGGALALGGIILNTAVLLLFIFAL